MPAAPAISIVVPVYNEEAAIGGLLDNLGAQGFAEVIVVDGGSTDRTAELASQRARFVRGGIGRAAQMNAGAAAASGETLLFLHADVRLEGCGRSWRTTTLRGGCRTPAGWLCSNSLFGFPTADGVTPGCFGRCGAGF